MHWICSAGTLRGDRPTNQDQFVVVDGAAAVLDGATSWLHNYHGTDPRDGGWYARALATALTARLPGHGTPLDEILAAAIADVRDTHTLTSGDSPYSTATLARWTTDHIDVLVLGDSPVLIRQTSGKTELVADERLAATAPTERDAYRDHLRHSHGFDTHFAELIAAVQRTERRSFNQPDGFWVAEAQPHAAHHAICRTFPAEHISGLTLLSDGAAAAVTDYRLTSWTDLAGDLARHGATAWLHRTHTAEESDPDGRRWPRTKRHDDKTTVHIEKITSP